MKLFGFYISRTDWEYLYKHQQECRESERKFALYMSERLLKLQSKQPIRDPQTGRFISKKNLMTEQLRTEVEKRMTRKGLEG